MHCIVLEHLEISLADLITSAPKSLYRGGELSYTLDYSASEASPMTEIKNDPGFSLEFVKKVGWQLANVLTVFSFEELNLVHGQISPSNIFLKKKGGFEIRLVDFSRAFYIDEYS